MSVTHTQTTTDELSDTKTSCEAPPTDDGFKCGNGNDTLLVIR